jgi:alpha-tubulin suppressor-like RCC1 family protein
MMMRRTATLLAMAYVTAPGLPCRADVPEDDGRDDGCAVSRVAVGVTHTCAVTRGGELFCWGDNGRGQLGDGSSGGEQSRPVRALLDGVSDVAGGWYFTCAVSRGDAYCWGDNPFGNLGDGTQGTGSVLPVLVLNGAVQVTAGEQHTCALTAAGGVECWGANYLGTVGDGVASNTNVLSPTGVVTLGSGVAQISSGDAFHTCARGGNGTLACWGSNFTGQLGDGTFNDISATPLSVTLPGPVSDVGAGFAHSCAVVERSLWCWGFASDGALGISSPPVLSDVPLLVPSLDRVERVSTGLDRTCAIARADELYCWGIEQNSSLFGLSGFVTQSFTPVRVAGLHRVSDIAVGYAHTCAIDERGRLHCWGANQLGQLGLGDTVDRSAPERVRLPCRHSRRTE